MTAFDALDEVAVPDQWDEITRRAAEPTLATSVPAIGLRHRRVPTALVTAAAILVVTTLVGLTVVWARDDGTTAVHTEPTDGPSTPTGADLTCLDGGLVAGSLPEHTSPEPLPGTELVAGQQARTWTQDGLTVELIVPPPQYIDFIGERTEEVEDPEGSTLWYWADGPVGLFVPTGLEGPCDGYQLKATGGGEDELRGLVLRIGRQLRWNAALGSTRDCGPLSPSRINTVEGATAMQALADLRVADVLLLPVGTYGAVDAGGHVGGGACTVLARTYGGLRPMVTMSGDDGQFGVDRIFGFAPNGVETDESTDVATDRALSVQVQGRSFSVFLDFWCSDCTAARLTLHYPDDDITATADITEPGAFTGDLPATPTPGSYGVIVITVEASQDDWRGVYVSSIPSGDFAAG